MTDPGHGQCEDIRLGSLELASNFSFLSQALKFLVSQRNFSRPSYRVVASAEGGRGACRGQDERRSQQRINSKCLHDVANVVAVVIEVVAGTCCSVS